MWKKRRDGTKRLFGGINVLFFGDWWQLKPVAGTSLFASPFGPAGAAQTGLSIFWGDGPKSVHRTYELTELARCKDPWYNKFLVGCRNGSLPLSLYHYMHGFPTFTPGSFKCDDTEETGCSSADCRKHLKRDPLLGWYREGWKDKSLQGHSGSQLMALTGDGGDCLECRRERQHRARVLPLGTEHRAEFSQQPFSSSPAIYNFNIPRYFTLLLRAREFAKDAGGLLSWCLARDVPLFADDRELPQAQLDENAENGCNGTTRTPSISLACCPWSRGCRSD